MKKNDLLYSDRELESLSSLAGGIAHDYNNILTVILGNVTLGKSLDPKDPEMLEILDSIKTAADTAKEINNTLISFSRITSVVLKEELLEPALKGVLKNCDINLSAATIPMDKSIMLTAFKQIELFFKAHEKEAGKIFISSSGKKKITLSFRRKNVYLTPEKWQKARGTQFSMKKKDYGISLLAAYLIVKKHGGTMEVSSSPEEGTEILLTLSRD